MTATPFLDLRAATRELRAEVDTAIARVLDSGRYLLGDELLELESEFARFSGASHGVGVGSGLDALVLSLRATGVGPGDEVLVPGQTFVATWLAVLAVGARPVAVDVDPRSCGIDVGDASDAVTAATRAVIPVDLFGRPSDMDGVCELARRHDLVVVQDAAQAHGARVGTRPVGATGAHATAWSFYPGKNLGALGDGGAVTTNDPSVAEAVRRLRNYGSRTKYVHEDVGTNSRLDELQAAVLRVKLRHLDAWNARRRHVAERYLDSLRGLDLGLPPADDDVLSSWHLFVVRTPARDALQRHLGALGVETLIHYPTTPAQQPSMRGVDASFRETPVADRWAAESLSLPIGPHLGEEAVDRVIAGVESFFS